MSEHLPYEQELSRQLTDLPLPDEDLAWEDMRRRLEKKDDDRPIVPPFVTGCGGFILLLILIIAAWIFAGRSGWFHRGSSRNEHQRDSLAGDLREGTSASKHPLPDSPGFSVMQAPAGIPGSISRLPGETLPVDITVLDTRKTIKNHVLIGRGKKRFVTDGGSDTGATLNRDDKKPLRPESTKLPPPEDGSNRAAFERPTSPIDPAAETLSPIAESGKAPADPGSDTLTEKAADSVARPEPSPVRKAFHFGAGTALFQLLPIGGQKTNPYNALGRKNSLADYIPSVYLRLYRENRWFIQGEFRYGAPQYTRDIVFNQIVVTDSINTSSTTSSSRVKKTFYHQLPLTFNYLISHDLSIGIGASLNRFNSAIVEQDVIRRDLLTQTDSLLSKGLVIPKKADSNFTKSYMQALVEAQYRWKRLSAGVRYSQGLQPFLTFSLPGEQPRRERNRSLQLFLRYEIWRCRPKK